MNPPQKYIALPLILFRTLLPILADDPDKSMLRFEMDNDLVFSKDSQFSNGFSLQWFTPSAEGWDALSAPGFAKSVGAWLPGMNPADSFVRFGHGIGQNIITPGDITAETPLEGDLPYAGTLTYSMSWMRFNERAARSMQVTLGILGEEAFAGEVQRFVHRDLGAGETPRGWNSQRETEPILNLAWDSSRRLAHFGAFDNAWAGQLEITPALSLGNLATGAEVESIFRFGWNIPRGFASRPAPPGRGIFNDFSLPKPPETSAHGFEIDFRVRVSGMLYSVLYDGSLITRDDRDVEREDWVYVLGWGVSYYFHDRFAVRLLFTTGSDLLKDSSIPDPGKGRTQTEADNSFGSLVFEYRY